MSTALARETLPLLTLRGIGKSFPGVRALNDVDLDVRAGEIYTLMRALIRRGYSIVMVSSELPEIVGMCDRVAVFWEGRIVRTLEGDDINPAEVMRHATAGGGSHELH